MHTPTILARVLPALPRLIDRLAAPAYLEVFDPNNHLKERLP